eukprot:5152336-Alexandrium_andersonii.AAC.1
MQVPGGVALVAPLYVGAVIVAVLVRSITAFVDMLRRAGATRQGDWWFDGRSEPAVRLCGRRKRRYAPAIPSMPSSGRPPGVQARRL